MKLRVPLQWWRAGAALGSVIAVAAVCHAAAVNATTLALALLLAILAASTLWGLAIAVLMSLFAVLIFNFFFLPPVGTLTIADPQNWVALFAFVTVAIVGSNLSARARREARQAIRSRRETERLYTLSQYLLEAVDVLHLAAIIPEHLVVTFGAAGAALRLSEPGETYRFGSLPEGIDAPRLNAVMLALSPVVDNGVAFSAIRQGTRTLGSFAVHGANLTRPTLEATGSLIAIAIDRARVVEQLGRAEAARESEQLKSVLLDSITHDFRTPLTAIKAAVTGLLGGGIPEAARGELLQVINQESDRLNGLIEEAAEMARIEAGAIELHFSACTVEAVVDAALEECRNLLAGRRLELDIPPGLPQVRADLFGAAKVLVRLIENADQYSPRSEPVTVAAQVHATTVRLGVADRGPGIPESERGRIFDRFYRGREQRRTSRGTGMGLPIARAIAEAHGGSVSLVSPPGPGSVFVFSLPRADLAAARTLAQL